MLTAPRKDGRLALPASLHNFLVALAAAHPQVYAPGPSDPVQPDDRALMLGLAVYSAGRGHTLTRLGQSVRHLFRDYASGGAVPDIDLADVMAAMPEDILNWLFTEGTLPQNSEGGRLFYALGGCVPMQGASGPRGCWLLTQIGREARERVRRQMEEDGGADTLSGLSIVSPLSPEARGVLGRLMAGVQAAKSFDGRVLKGLDARGLGLIDWPTPDTVRIVPECYELVKTLILDVRDAVMVLLAFPEDDQDWFLNDFLTAPDNPRAGLFVKLGLTYARRRGASPGYTTLGGQTRDAVLNRVRDADDEGVSLLDADDEFDILSAHSRAAEADAPSEEDFEII